MVKSRRKPSQKAVVGVVFVLSMFMAIMDITIVNVALPTLGRDFHVPATGVDAVVTGFLVSLAVFIPASGWLGDRFGTKRVLLVAIAVFTVASALCGQAHSLGELVGFRVLQGVGGGMLTPVGMAMLFRTYPPEERVRASRILIVPTAFAPAIGPVIGGLFVTHFTWRLVFYVNVPIGFVAFVFGLLFLDEHCERRPGRFDVLGFALCGAGFAGVMYAVSEGPSQGWGSPAIVATGLAGAALVSAFVAVELRVGEPMIELRLLANRLFANASAVMFLATMAFLGSLYLVALFYQDGLGLSALTSGLSTFPEAFGVMAGAQIAARLYPRFGPRRIIAGGMASVAAVLGLLALAGSGTSLWLMRGLMLLLGTSIGHVFVPTQTAAFATIEAPSMGRASGLFNADRQLGSAVGVALLTTVLAAAGAGGALGHGTHLTGYHLAFATGATLALAGSLVALLIDDRDAAATMGPAVGTGNEATVPGSEEVPAPVGE